jgi:hypothetical protein
VEDPTLATNPASGENDPRDQNAEFELLSKELAEKESELSTLEERLSLFEGKYARSVGVLFAELDELEREIARELLRLNPQEEYRRGFQKAERKAKKSRDAVDEKVAQSDRKPFEPSDELRDLFRKVARAIHPDLAADPRERAFRNTLMARANEAYRRGDIQGLKQIMDEWENRDKRPYPEQAELIKVDQLEQILRQIRLRINTIEARISELEGSELYQLMLKVEMAELEGLDLLGEMARGLQEQILAAKELLADLQQKE